MPLKSGMEVRETVRKPRVSEKAYEDFWLVSKKDEREGRRKTCFVPGHGFEFRGHRIPGSCKIEIKTAW